MGKLVIRKLGVSIFCFLTLVLCANAQVNVENNTYKTAELKDAVGKRKIIILNGENNVRTDITKQLVKSGFLVVDDRKGADLILELTSHEAVTEYDVVANKSASRKFTSKILTITVILVKADEEYSIYAQTFDNSKKQTIAAAYGIMAPPPSPSSQAKHLVKDFLNRLKMAGDKFK